MDLRPTHPPNPSGLAAHLVSFQISIPLSSKTDRLNQKKKKKKYLKLIKTLALRVSVAPRKWRFSIQGLAFQEAFQLFLPNLCASVLLGVDPLASTPLKR
jgi:hypothetical protein